MAKFIYFVIYGKVFFNVCVSGRYIRFGLIIIVIRHEILHSVFGEKLAELVTKLSREGFIVSDNEGRALDVLNYVRHSERFSAARHADENLRS